MKNIELYIIPNVNPSGRKKVEEGYTCWRSNKDIIDPNRNWGYGHRPSPDEDISLDSNGDKKPFSIPETISIN